MSKQIIFTCSSLDGAGCCLAYKWLTNIIVPHITLTQGDLRKGLTEWLAKNNFSSYDKVNFFGLDTSDCKDLIDYQNVLIIDHHKDHANDYKNAKTLIAPSNTSTHLIYKHLLSKVRDIDTKQKLLIAVIDKAYEQPTKHFLSKDMRVLFSKLTGDRVERFCIDFQKGFENFTDKQKNLIDFHHKTLNNLINELEIYRGEVDLKGKRISIISTVAEHSQYDLSDYLCDKYQCDIVMIVTPKANKVLFRKNLTDLHIGKFAKVFANGNGSEYTATGAITEEVLSLTKCLNPLS